MQLVLPVRSLMKTFAQHVLMDILVQNVVVMDVLIVTFLMLATAQNVLMDTLEIAAIQVWIELVTPVTPWGGGGGHCGPNKVSERHSKKIAKKF